MPKKLDDFQITVLKLFDLHYKKGDIIKKLLSVIFIISFISIMLTALTLIACKGKTGAREENKTSIDQVSIEPYLVDDYRLEPPGGKTAFDYFKEEKIFSGWNLGNTLDSFSGSTGNETGWGNPPVNQELMNGVKAAGFDLIRIPVTWMGHIGAAPDYRIAPSRLNRVGEVVRMAHDAGLKVIINLHHDGATASEQQESGWLSVGKSYRNEADYKRITDQFTHVWEQIAVYFQNYGDWLMFESMNEIHDGGWCWSSAFRSNPGKQLEIVNNWNQVFTDAVRAAGGNNAERYLVIPAYCTNPQQTLSDSFKLPRDSAANRQVVTFHYYDPYEFGIQGSRFEWGSPADKKKTEDDFAPFKTRFIDKNIPVIIGECGAVLQLYPNDPVKQEQARKSRFEYIPYVFAAAKKYTLVPIFWDNGATGGNGEKFGLLDRRTGRPNSEDSAALIRSMINAVK